MATKLRVIKKIDILLDEALKTPQGREVISDHVRKGMRRNGTNVR